jgi:hypothetical protein
LAWLQDEIGGLLPLALQERNADAVGRDGARAEALQP